MNGVLKKLSPEPTPVTVESEPFWPDTHDRIASGRITPIIGNPVTALLFGVPPAQLAQAWAEDIHSPLTESENCDLAHVAQFHAVLLKEPAEAKRQYLEALKEYLVASAKDNQSAVPAEIIQEFLDAERRRQISLSDLARRLGYPRYPSPMENPLRLLAELPLPIYLTTSPHKFLEIELERTAGRKPESALFCWHDGLRNLPSIFDREPDYRPTFERPLVYHLFGDDDYAESLVLTEDDHLDYLVKLSTLTHEVKHTDKALDIPASVSLALTGTTLLLLGYQITDWDFRILFRGLVQATGETRNKFTPKSICMQVEPSGELIKQNEIKTYLDKFFEQSHFNVYWGDMTDCIARVYRLWKGSSS